MRIYSCGCSFTYGTELPTPQTSSWPAIFAQKYDAELYNVATGGGSNYRTLYQTTKHLQYDYDLYLIAWSEYSRFTFYKSNNNDSVGFNVQLAQDRYGNDQTYRKWGETLYKEWYNDLFAFKIWLQQIIQLQKLLENRNYLMINTFENNLDLWLVPKDRFIEKIKHLINFDSMDDDQIFDEFNEIQYYISLIDTSKFYRWKEFHIGQLCSQFKCGPRGHFLEEGHTYLADLIYNYVQNKISNS